MIDRRHKADALGEAGQRRWRATLDERIGPLHHAAARPDEGPRMRTAARLAPGLACLGSALISAAALVLITQWISPS
jgi:hypothetical protein